MTAAAEELLRQMLALPEGDRVKVAEALLESVDAAGEVDTAWQEEVERRMEQVAVGDVELESWDAVRTMGRQALDGR